MIILLLAAPLASSSELEGTVTASYIYLDEEGNRSVNQPTFNTYEGAALSLEDFRYYLDNGMRLSADMKNITLNNRDLNLGITKPGLFGVNLTHNQYRRFYDFDGGIYTRRHREGGNAWIRPHKYIKIFGGGSFNAESGSMIPLYDGIAPGEISDMDYEQMYYNGGILLNHEGRTLRAELRGSTFDVLDSDDRDQERMSYSIFAAGPVPHLEAVSVFGGFRRFESWYMETDYKIESNRGFAGSSVKLPQYFRLKYMFVFDRTGSDSDFVKTDNVSHGVFLSRIWKGMANVTLGYQRNYNDDFEDEIQANSFYFSGWLKPIRALELRAQFGTKEDDLKSGNTVLGDQYKRKFRFSTRYRHNEYGTVTLRVDANTRKSDLLDTKSEFLRTGLDIQANLMQYASLTGGCSRAVGHYENTETDFEFHDYIVFADISSMEYHNVTGGFGFNYYWSSQELDVERSMLEFRLGYRFLPKHKIEVQYNVHNFDDFIYTGSFDEYYTANIVEVKLINDLAF